jgi:prolipoprotein diacylglyceryltransferase
MEFTLLFAVFTAVAFLWVASRALSGRLAGIPHPVDTLIGVASIGLFAGRIAAMIIDGVNPVTNPFQILLVRAGVDTRVAAATAVAALLWTTRDRIPQWVDALAPVAVAGLAGWHGGCVWRGTCLGAASDVPWAFGLPGSTVTRHPVELYAAAGLLLVAVIVARLPLRPWMPAGLAVAGAALVRLVTEPLRPSLDGGPVWFYGAALAVGIIVALVGPSVRKRPATRSG